MKHAKHANFLKHAILRSTPMFWSTLSTQFYEARQACKHGKHANTKSTPSTHAHQAREYSKHVSTQARHLADSSASYLAKINYHITRCKEFTP